MSTKFLKGLFFRSIMARFEFEKDLDSYISTRRKVEKSFDNNFAHNDAPKAPVSEAVKRTSVDVCVSNDDVNSEYAVYSKGAFSRIAGWMFGAEEKHDAPLDVVNADNSALYNGELKADMRELAKISISTFRKLPVHRLREFKSSGDFERFKGILKKHGLSKE